MAPTLRDGEVLVAWRGARVRPGCLVVCQLPDGRPLAVKRVTMWMPEGGWWVERDNLREGVDSWLVGPIAEDRVLAVVVGRLWGRPAWWGGSGRWPEPPTVS